MNTPFNPKRRNLIGCIALALITFSLLLAFASASGADENRPAIDAIFAGWDKDESPGCALGVVEDGRMTYQRGYGMANLDYGVPITPDTIFYIGSVSKQFAAASILLLSQEGKISLDDDIRKYVPEMPEYEESVTIRHLVHHTSGIRDIYTLMSLAGLRIRDVFPDQEAIDLIARQRELNFKPGAEHLYSNSGYFLMSEIVERVTKSSLREYADKMIFAPLGMTNTHFHDSTDHVFKNRAISYQPDMRGGFKISYLQNFNKVGAGGLYTTIGDLLKWDQNFYHAKVGGRDFLETLQTTAALNNGKQLEYAFGLTVSSYRGLPVVGHGGAMMGFKAAMIRFPEQKFTAMSLCNLGNIEPMGLVRKVADIHLKDQFTEEASTSDDDRPRTQHAKPVALESSQLVEYAGVYSSSELGVSYELVVRKNRLFLIRPNQEDLAPDYLGDDRFRLMRLGLQFERSADGAVSGFRVEAGRVKNILFEKR